MEDLGGLTGPLQESYVQRTLWWEAHAQWEQCVPVTLELSLFPQSSSHPTDSFKLPGLSSAKQNCTEVYISCGQSGLRDVVNKKRSTQSLVKVGAG